MDSTNLHSLHRARFQQRQECGSICVIVEKFPREAKCLTKGVGARSRVETSPSVYHQDYVAS